MSLNIRNLVLLALLCSIALSTCLSPGSHKRSRSHMLRVHETAEKYFHQQDKTTDTTKVVSNLNAIVQKISDSVNKDTPSIIQTKNLENIEFSKQNCEDITQEQKDALFKKIDETQTKVTDFSKNLTNQKVKNDTKNVNEYLELLEFVLNRDCNDLNNILIGITPLQTNINTNEAWILGGVKLPDLVQQYVNRISKYNNITNCNDKTPFFNGVECIKCSDSTPIFNISSSKCVACPAGTKYDQPTKNCISSGEVVYKPNSSAGIPKTILGVNQTQKDLDTYYSGNGTECPIETPFVVAGKCASCPTDKTFFSLETKTCAICPTGSKLDTTTHKCVTTTTTTVVSAVKPNTNAGTPKVLLGANQTQKDIDTYFTVNGTQCPTDSPFVIDGKCAPCPADKPLFSLESKTCSACPAGTKFDVATHKCVSSQTTYKPNASAGTPKVILGSAQTQKDIDAYFSGNGTQCPADSPFVISGKCAPCPVDKPYLSLQTKQCALCPVGYTLNSSTHKCVPGKPQATDVTVQNPTLKMNANSTDDDWNKYVQSNKNKVLCPVDKPYWNGTECISCPVYFNIITKKCDICEEGLILNVDSHKCEPGQPLSPSLMDLFNVIF